jgi:hypothetical protein
MMAPQSRRWTSLPVFNSPLSFTRTGGFHAPAIALADAGDYVRSFGSEFHFRASQAQADGDQEPKVTARQGAFNAIPRRE